MTKQKKSHSTWYHTLCIEWRGHALNKYDDDDGVWNSWSIMSLPTLSQHKKGKKNCQWQGKRFPLQPTFHSKFFPCLFLRDFLCIICSQLLFMLALRLYLQTFVCVYGRKKDEVGIEIDFKIILRIFFFLFSFYIDILFSFQHPFDMKILKRGDEPW